MRIAELYAATTARIVAELERGDLPAWVRPWKNGPARGVLPINVGGRDYSGSNILLLWAAKEAKGYPTSIWMTFKQSCERGWRVKRGEKGTPIIFTKRLTVKEDDEDRKVQMARTYYVFNEAQIEGIEPKPAEDGQSEKQPDRIPTRVDRFIRAPGIPIRIGGNKACYVPSQDFIALPEESAFKTVEHSFATALHELTHATGHQSRLNRDLKNRFGTEAYAAEELVAELGSAFLCAHLGVEGMLRHQAAYVDHWIALLKKDDRAIFTAASQASKAADWLRSWTELVQEEEP